MAQACWSRMHRGRSEYARQIGLAERPRRQRSSPWSTLRHLSVHETVSGNGANMLRDARTMCCSRETLSLRMVDMVSAKKFFWHDEIEFLGSVENAD